MSCILFRNGIAVEWHDWKGDDRTRPLTEEGIEKTKKAVKGLEQLDVHPTQLLCSPFTRTQQTAKIAKDILGFPSDPQLCRELLSEASPPDSKKKCTTLSLVIRRWCMTKSYRHFDHKERTLIYWWRKENLSQREMARRLRRSHASISLELRRNLWCGLRYCPRGAQILYDYRVVTRATRYRLKSKQIRD